MDKNELFDTEEVFGAISRNLPNGQYNSPNFDDIMCMVNEICELGYRKIPQGLTPKYKKGDTVYHIEYVGIPHQTKGNKIVKEAVEYKVKAVHIGKTKVSYSLNRFKSRIDEKWLFATRLEADLILKNGE